MTGLVAAVGRRSRSAGTAARRFWTGVSAVATKDLRGRMRGRRAFAVLTIYLLLLSVFAFAIYVYLRQQALLTSSGLGSMPQRSGVESWYVGSGAGTALAANIGHGIFGGLLLVETLLIVVLAPALTSGAISLEREKQTIDMLVTTPLSTLGMVIGKLLSALTYVFLLIMASIPLASVVFVFGGVGPEDLLRGYVVLFAVAFGMGAIGLFVSALVRRTQSALVTTFVVVLVLVIGSFGLHEFWKVASRPAPTGGLIVAQRPHDAPEAVLWLNPFVADIDLVCTTAPGSFHRSCEYLSSVTGRPYFGSDYGYPTVGAAEPAMDEVPDGRAQDGDEPVSEEPVSDEPDWDVPEVPPPPTETPTMGFPRDTFWPKSAASFVIVGLVLTLASAQLVAPTRRTRLPFRLPRRGGRTGEGGRVSTDAEQGI